MKDVTQSIEKRNPLRAAWRKSRPGLMAVVLFSIVVNLLKLAAPIYILQLLDNVIASRSQETLTMLAVITAIAMFFAIWLEVIRRQVLVSWGSWIERFFGPILLAAGLKSGDSHSMRTTNILRDVKIMRSFVAGKAFVAWLDLLWVPIFIGIIFLISPPLSYTVALGCLLAFLLGMLNERVAQQSRDTTYKAGRDDQDWIAAAERNHETVSSLGVVSHFVRRWHNSAFARLDESMRARLLSIYFTAIIRLIGAVVRIVAMGVGVWLVIEEDMTIGTLIATSVLVHIAYTMVQEAITKWHDITTVKQAYQRVKTALKKDNETQPISIPQSDKPVPLVVDNASYRYPSQSKYIFKNINLTLNPGEALFVIGPSASGKTTFSRLICGLLSPRAGTIRLGDVGVYQFQQNTVLRTIGNLAQDTSLFRGSIRENIASMSEGDIDKVVRAAKLAGIHDTILTLPEGYDTFIVEYEPLLSSGQRKAIALARTFYDKPALIVLDEPFPHLDKSTRLALFKAIEQLKSEGAILVITTQSKVPSKYADKVIMFDGGQKCRLLLSDEEISSLRSDSRGRRKHNKKPANSTKSPA